MNNKAGVREDDERRRAYRSAITDLQRHRDESLAQFAVRRMRDFAHASQYGVIIPDPFKATLLREGAGLNDQNQQNLSTLLQGQDECPQAVARALSRLDVRSDRMTGFAAGENAPEEDTGSYLGHIPEDEESLDEDDIAHELEALDLTEDQVLEVYAVLDAKRQRPRSWKENKEFKAELKKDRGAFVKGGPVGAGGRERRGELHRSGRTKMNKEQLKKISRCRICMKKGHWAEDCDANKNKKPVVAFAYSSSLQGGASAFSFITFQALYEAVREVQFKEDKSLPSFLTLPSGEAILDTGATQDLIGEVALQSIGIHLNTMASTRAQHPLVSSGSQEASLILEQAINSMSVQNSQLATTLGEINHSLQELARGQGQMIMMTAGMGNPHQALVLSPEQAPSGYDGPEQACIMSPEQAPGGPVLSPEQAPSDYVLSPGQAPGGNFEFVDDKAFRQYRKKRRPRMMMASPACKAFTHLRHIYQERMDPETCRRTVAEGHLMWNFAMEACEEQIAEGNFFGLEHPRLAASWRLPRTQRLLQRDDVVLMSFDQCFFGLSVVPSGTLSRKSTCIATNNPWLALELVNAVCRGDHDHETLIGGLPRKAQEYPAELCSAIARGAQAVALGLNPPSFLESAEVYELTSPGCWFGEEEEEAEDETNPPNEPEQYTTPVSDSQRRLVQKVHVNTGHPDRLRMLRAFKAAGALPQVLRYIREEFGCEDCQLKRGPDNRRRAQLPRTFSFNRVLCADFLFIRFKECQIPIMNLTCAGTSYQIAVRCRETKNGTPTSAAAWRLFMDSWVRYFGAPHLLVTDSGNEFRGAFERGLEFQGILQHVIHPECPWQNGKAERHGGWLKDRLDSELQSGRCIFTNLEELDEFIAAILSTKNRWLNKGGFTPAQLVFGELPRIPGELLAEDELGLHGLHDAHEDPAEVDEAAGEYRRRHQIRERARQLAMTQASREAIRRSRHAAPQQQRHWAPGQWVYVFRRARGNQDLHLRDRWVGPGVVVVANNDTIYVGMRTRLWRCSPGQLRAALPSEVLGRELATSPGLSELLRQVVAGTHAGAVDVQREGLPGPEDRLGPVHRIEEGVAAASSAPSQQPAVLPSPQELIPPTVEAIPPGLLPLGHHRGERMPSIAEEEERPSNDPTMEELPHLSRRSSVNEPASEPGEQPQASGPGPPALPDDPSAPAEPPLKMVRTTSPEHVMESDPPSSSQPSSAAAVEPAPPELGLLERPLQI
eukprot:g21468.t1